MADFSSLKQTIQSYIKQNGNEEITGNILQDVLLAMVSTMGDSAINSLASALQDEIAARQNQDLTLQGNITAEATARQQADTALGGRIDGLQTVINGINTKLAEGYIYAGIATPSTNPGTPSGKVFYIAVQAGTYTNFSSLAVTQGITILKYNGTAWSQEQFIGIDDEPTAGSGHLVKSGGVYEVVSQLDQEINGLPSVNIDLSEYELITGTIYSDNKFYNTGGFAYHRIKMIPCGDYAGRNVTIVPGPASLSYNTFSITFLKENVVAGSEVVYATGYAYPLVYTGEQTLEIPVDAQYLYIYIKDTRQESDITPSSVIINEISGVYKATEVDALLLPLKESIGTDEWETSTVYKTGSIFFIKEYPDYKDIAENTIIIVERKSGVSNSVRATIIRNGSDIYPSFSQIDNNTFVLQILQGDKIQNLFSSASSGVQVGDTYEIYYKSGIISELFNIESGIEHNVGINQSEDVTAFAEGNINYIKKYSPYLTFSYPVTIVAERKSGTATELLCEIDRGGTTQYLGFTRISETTFVFKEQVGDAIRSLYIGYGAAGDKFTITYKSFLNAETFDLESDVANINKRVFRKNLNWVAIGDSLTDVQTLGVGVDNYVNLVARALQLNPINKGESGTGYMKEQDIDRAFYQRIQNFTENADIVTIFGSFNDLSAGNMGTALDTGTTTVGGCMNETINALTLKYPDALIGIIAPTPWWESFDYTTHPQYRQYIELLKEVARRYSIPFLNLFEGSNLRPWDATFKANYFKNGDGTHPNTAGHRRIAGIMQDFIEQMIYSASPY